MDYARASGQTPVGSLRENRMNVYAGAFSNPILRLNLKGRVNSEGVRRDARQQMIKKSFSRSAKWLFMRSANNREPVKNYLK